MVNTFFSPSVLRLGLSFRSSENSATSATSAGPSFGLSTAPFQGGPNSEANFDSIVSQRFVYLFTFIDFNA
jgi:hypothetical protein